MLEAEVEKLKAFDQQIDKKLHRTKLHFEELREKLKSFVWCFIYVLKIVMHFQIL